MRNKIFKIVVLLLIQCSVLYGQNSISGDHNYILTRTPLAGTSDINSLPLRNCMHTIQYLDRFGRPEETILLKRSPLSCDIINYQEYDSSDRITNEWLPAPSESDNDGNYIDSGTQIDLARDFYNDFDPLTTTSYESSFHNKISKKQGIGEAWTAASNSIKMNYTSNKKDGSSFSCAHFKVSYSNDTLITIKREIDYNTAELYVTSTTNEDNRVTYEFKNRLGQTLLIRQLSGNNHHDTYYVYDDFGNTAAVLPPAASELLSEGNSYNNNSSAISRYAYLYCYDKRGYCIGKKLPAAAWTYYIYDKAGRLVLTQDGNMRKQNKWLFSIPDSHGRSVLSGTYNAQHNAFNSSFSETLVTAIWKGSAAPNSTFYGYQPQGINITSPTIESVNYYDNYEFKSYNSLNAEYDCEDLTGYDKQYPGGQQGMLTGSITRATSGNVLYAVFYYDERENMVQSKQSNLLGGKEKNYFTYNFRKKPIKHRHVHTANNKTIAEVYNYNYDHGERLIKTTYQPEINGTALAQITLADKEYDEVGRLSRNKLHGLSSLNIDYTYNPRSWITSISASAFKQNIYYNDGEGVPCYSGNISSMTWQGKDNIIRGYKFSYDNLSRMTDAIYGEGNSINANLNRFTEQITEYDKNGNIKKLKRYGQTGANAYGLVDNLTLELKGNQLKTVSDAATATAYNNGFEFKKGANATIEYDYDSNGNLTKDLNKDIKEIQYNFLNLPSLVKFLDESTITYTYGADGTKLRTVHKIGSVTTTTDYCGNVIYENNTAKLLLTEEGYVSLNDNKYHYYLKDHQGNNRVVVDPNGNVEETNHYYPFGGVFANTGNAQPYKYNGKELDAKKGLNWYDYGARHYDAALGRWHAVDPMAEKYYSTSPYTYCLGKPQNAIDYQGKLVIFINGFTTNKQEQASVEYWSKSFVGQLTNQLKDNHVLYRHGGNSFDWRFRKFVGELQGLIDAPNLIKYISDKEGNIIETIKVITHSMGTAYGKGYVEAILKYFKEKGYTNALVTLEADFDPFQAGSLSIIPNVYTQQFTHNKMFGGDYWYIANQKQKGLENYYNDKQQGSHAITSFFNDISKLKEGTYIWNGSTWILEE